AWGRARLGPAGDVAAGLGQAGLEVLEAASDELPAAERASVRDFLARADMGLTAADLAIAETGSLVIVSGPGAPRAVSLLPPCHVAVFGRGALVPGLEEAGVVLQAWQCGPPEDGGSNVVFVTGPSRTADIELTLTRGVHGPKEVHAVFVDAL
ncbi:MAG: lactate utilization protein, partial [Candidatus Rokuibacteriota bacterium]